MLDGANHVVIEVVDETIDIWVNDAHLVHYTEPEDAYAAGQEPITFGGMLVRFGWESTGWVDNVRVTRIPFVGEPAG